MPPAGPISSIRFWVTAGGFSVAQEIADAMQANLLPRADIITPNHYELSWLSGRDVGGQDDSTRAASELIDRYGLTAVITTGVGRGWAHR